MIHVNRGTTSVGVFSEQEIREGLSAGRFAPTDIGWREGMATWQPLSRFPEFGGAASAAVPPVQSGATPASTIVAGRSGLPWEHRQERGFFNAFIETLSLTTARAPVAPCQVNPVFQGWGSGVTPRRRPRATSGRLPSGRWRNRIPAQGDSRDGAARPGRRK